MMLWYTDTKTAIAAFIGLNKDFIHVYVGVIGLLLLAALLRRKMGDWRPLAVLALLGVINELLDLYGNWIDDRHLYWDHSAVDMANTLILPLILTACARWTNLFQPAAIVQSDEAPCESPADGQT